MTELMRKAKVLKKNMALLALLDAIDMGVWPSYLALLMYPYCREIPLNLLDEKYSKNMM